MKDNRKQLNKMSVVHLYVYIYNDGGCCWFAFGPKCLISFEEGVNPSLEIEKTACL